MICVTDPLFAAMEGPRGTPMLAMFRVPVDLNLALVLSLLVSSSSERLVAGT